MRYELVQDKRTSEVYAVERDGGDNVIAFSHPIPFFEVGHVVASRYVMAEAGAAEFNLRPLKVLGPTDIHVLGLAYAGDRRGLPVVDGTPQDGTQPEARPETVPGPNPPEFGKAEGETAVHDQGDDDTKGTPDTRSADEIATQDASGIAARAGRDDTGERVLVPTAHGNDSTQPAPDFRPTTENEGEKGGGETDLNEQTALGTTASADHPEQYAPREGANLKEGADLRREGEMADPAPAAVQDGRHTADAENGAASDAGSTPPPDATDEKETDKSDKP